MKSLNNKLILEALSAYKTQLGGANPSFKDETYFNNFIKIKAIEQQMELLTQSKMGVVMAQQEGGEWLGVIHSWIQRKAHNGETCIWGSDEPLRGVYLSPRVLENLAASIAAAAINEFKGTR